MGVLQRWGLKAGMLTTVVVGFCFVGSLGAQTAFVEGLNDVPMMPGLTALGDTLVFDKPGGRIAEAVLTGTVSADTVRKFYGQTLPQLGWAATRPNHFVREKEELTLHVGAHGPAATVRLVIEPYR